ncbi:hypothetical protein GCM10023322_71380 [Rugosimonospora acidiphila]|uniref:Uncharacterized protein n=1 Tax=Rugosimonospora acidiphila TaxID=556531 RepID=A0ABP9SNC3_9ACTN
MPHPGREASFAPAMRMDGQREPGAGANQPIDRGRFRRDPGLTHDQAEEFPRLRLGHHVEVDVPGAGQIGQPGPAGDQDGTARGPGQQRPDLGGSAGVVEQQQYPAAGQQAAETRPALRLVGRHVARSDAEIAQQPGEHVPR